MAKTVNKMTCPSCGAQMNHHSDKLVYPADPQDMAKVEPATGGLVEEFHTCPQCGRAASPHA